MKKRLFIIALIVLTTAGLTFAQLTPEGRINGRIVDQQGNPLPGVNVEAVSPRLIGKATAVTDANGVYRLMALSSGTYEITFTLQGFKTLIRKGILLELSQTLALDVTLEEATIEEQVTVIGQSPLIDVKSTVKGQVMTKETYMSLPRGRSFDSLISTIPGVQVEAITGGISVDGASGAENVFYVDGADVTNFHLGVEGQNVVLELLDEVKVTASGYNAEFGGSMGGVVNVITRTGGNEFHGDIMGFYENNSRLMRGYARDYLRSSPLDDYVYEYVNNDTLYFDGGKARDNYDRYEGIVSLGGYLVKDKLWFFGSLDLASNRTIGSRDFALGAGPFSSFKAKDDGLNGSFKLTAAPAPGLRLAASFVNNFTRYRGVLPSLVGNDDSTYEYGQEGMDYPNWTGALTADYSVGNDLLLSYRGGYHLQNENNQQLLPPMPRRIISPTGTPSTAPTRSTRPIRTSSSPRAMPRPGTTSRSKGTRPRRSATTWTRPCTRTRWASIPSRPASATTICTKTSSMPRRTPGPGCTGAAPTRAWASPSASARRWAAPTTANTATITSGARSPRLTAASGTFTPTISRPTSRTPGR